MRGFWAMLAGAVAAMVLGGPSVAKAGSTECVSLGSEGELGNGPASSCALSADARFAAFSSRASNLVPGDTNGYQDIFVRDRAAGSTERASVSSAGAQGDADCWRSTAISANGRFVAFVSPAGTLAGANAGGLPQVLLRDRVEGTTIRVTTDLAGGAADGSSNYPKMTPGGEFLCLLSSATNLTPAGTNGQQHVFVWERATGLFELLSVSTEGVQANGPCYGGTLSDDGRVAAFSSEASNLVDGDTNGVSDVFVRDRDTGTTERVSVSTLGVQGNGASYAHAISGDGRYVAFYSAASNLVEGDTNETWDVFLHDRYTGVTERVSVGFDGSEANGKSLDPAVSRDGRFVAFTSYASNLVPGDTNARQDVFVRDRAAGVTLRVSVSHLGQQVNGDSFFWDMTPDGRFIAFASTAADLVPGDTNCLTDMFLRDRRRFVDVGVEHWAYYAVEACVGAGVVGGYPDGSYQPEVPVSRDQMAVYIARALAGGDAAVPPGPGEATFPDVPTDYWAFRHVEYAVAAGVVEGYPDGSYHPEIALDRGQMAVFIARALAGGEAGVPEPTGEPTFADVPADFWARKHIEYIADPGRGVAQGYPDGGYHPEYACSRDQMAVYVRRAFQLALQ